MLNITFNENLDSRYIDKEAEKLNTYFKSFIPQDVYVDIYNKNVIKYDKKTKTPYMFDDNHLSHCGADQVVDYLTKNYKY